MKSLPVPLAAARRNFSDVVNNVRRGERVRLTRHGKTVGWLIGTSDHAQLDRAGSGSAKRARKPKSK